MKTSVIMYRDLNGVNIRQDSKTQFFNANDLLDLYNNGSDNKKVLQSYMVNKSTEEFAEAIVKDQISNSKNSYELESAYYSKRGKFGGTWMHPYLFMDFAMWLSVDFKLTCIKWMYDNLIKFRNEAGDTFKEMNHAIYELKPSSPPWVYSNEAKMINKVVFGSPDSDQRNTATEDQLDKLKQLQKANGKLIEEGFDYHERYDKLREFKKFMY